MKDKISFSSLINGTMYHCFIDLTEEVMTIRKNVQTVTIDNSKEKAGLLKKEKYNSKEDVLFFGTIAEFKELEKNKSSIADRVYISILDMSEKLIEMFSKA